MENPFPSSDAVDVGWVDDPQVRRVLRSLQLQITENLHRQQLEMDAILEMAIEIGLGSMSEFKRHLTLLQQNRARGQRIHDAIAAVTGQQHENAESLS